VRRLLIPLLAIATFLSAQEYRGTFSGAVTDAQGSAVPKAKINATETNTNTKADAVTDDTGQYTIPFLAPGTYDITAESAGFKKFVRRGLTLSAGEHPVIDIRMEVGSVTDAVTVTAEAPILVTANPSLGQVITSAEVEDIPINGRTPMMLDNLAMGVVSTFEPGPVRPFDNSAANDISIGGVPATRNEVLLDGAPNAGQSNQMAYSPMVDAVTEVRVQAFDMDASSGHTMGGTVNVVTKSGTNSLHGTAYIYNQTSAVDANGWFNNSKGVPRPPYHQNQYGVTSGGPVFVPKIVNAKNRVFWFFGWEGMKDSDPANSPLETGNPQNFATVPTAAERQGNFSQLLTLAANPVTIYDPNSGVLSGNLVSRTPFPGNVIPTNRINPIAAAYLNYYPQPNTPGLANGLQNYVISAINSDGYDNELGRLDINISDRNRLSFDARHSYRAQNKGNNFNNAASGNYLYRINQGASLDDVYTISPTLVADVRANWTRYIENHSSPADTVDPSTLGFPSYIDGVSEFKMMPYITFLSTGVTAGAEPTFQQLGYNADATNYTDIFQVFGEMTKIHGNHTIKFGADGREYRWSGFTFGNPSGTYAFTGTWTNDPAVSNTNVYGQDFAQFLLGVPNGGSLDLNTQSTAQAKYLGVFVNDDWRVKSNFTLNLGLRFDHDFPETERYNRSVNGFNPTAATPISAAAAAAYAASPNALLPTNQFNPVGGLTFPGSGSPSIYNTNSKIFSPRVGFAWTPHVLGDKTVLRGGVGILVDPMSLPNPLFNEGFSQQTTIPLPSPLIGPLSTLSNPFPNGFLRASGSSLGAGTYLGNSISFNDPNVRNPYTARWEFSIQRQLPAQMVLEVAYIGSHTVHEPINTELNYIPAQYLSTSLVRNNALITQLTGTVPNPFKGLVPGVSSFNGSTIALQQLIAPYPQFPVWAYGTSTTATSTSNGTAPYANSGVIMYNNPAGSGYFESLNVRLQKRYGNGLILISNFSWNRMEDRLAYLNPTDPAPEKRISSDSRPLREVLAVTYELPIGRGKKLSLQAPWMNSLVGGWQLSSVLTLQSGPPLNWGVSAGSNLPIGDFIYNGSPLNLQPHQPNGTAFNTAAFNTVSTQQLEFNIQTFDLQYNNLRRDYTNEIDLSMDKKFKFTERKYVQIRFEAYNLQNRVTFGAPNTTPTNAAFGTISTQANTPRRLESAIRLVW
jgi:hypothetical protein